MKGHRSGRSLGGWLLVAVAVALIVVLMVWAGADWSEAIVQGLAALGGAWFWAYRSRPRVTLRLRSADSVYLELANVGNRVAKEVRVRCDPPIPWNTTMAISSKAEFGPVENFGDMDVDQRYVVPVGGLSKATAAALEETTFAVSHKRTWGFGRRESTIRFGDSALSTIRDDAPTAIGQLVNEAKRHGKKLDRIEQAANTVADRLLPPAEGGVEIALKACATCDWHRFCYSGDTANAAFWCANCGSQYERNMNCECAGMWCKHRPAPRQCSRQR